MCLCISVSVAHLSLRAPQLNPSNHSTLCVDALLLLSRVSSRTMIGFGQAIRVLRLLSFLKLERGTKSLKNLRRLVGRKSDQIYVSGEPS